ncbi:hypothetical protein [Nannocystis pusilla]|uniref:hypothetical protein n=1 Tax=Nannocystis pusilla TaxID=889268 RepID=UPI003B80E849
MAEVAVERHAGLGERAAVVAVDEVDPRDLSRGKPPAGATAAVVTPPIACTWIRLDSAWKARLAS